MRAQTDGTNSALIAVLVISDLEFGGAQRQVIELANHMDPAVCKIYVCSLSGFVPLADSLTARNERLKFILRKFRFDFTVVPRLASLLRRLKADVVHSYLFDATVAARLASRLAQRVVMIGSERNTDYVFKKSDFFAYRLTKWCTDITIANSRAGAQFNSRVFHQPLNRYRVVHNGVDVDRFKFCDASQLRAELGLEKQRPVVGMFASFKPQKNHPLWLRAARRVLQRVPNVRFLFVGDELYRGMSNSTQFKKTIREMVTDFGLEESCLFVGNKADVENYYNVCHVTVLPSLFEGTPNVALESMACGVPVVATDVSDNAYVVPDGRVGYVVPLGDEEALADRVSKILENESLRRRMSIEARAWVVHEFSCKRLAEKTVAVYREAMQMRNRDYSSPVRDAGKA